MKRRVIIVIEGEDNSNIATINYQYPTVEFTSDVNLENNGAVKLARLIEDRIRDKKPL